MLGQHTKFQLPSHKLQCFSVACLDMPHLEFGDKIVLPPKILLELQCMKIPTPLLFMVRDASLNTQLKENNMDEYSCQYCSVQEFSAPDGQVFLPYWLMQNLHVPEGGSVVVTSAVNLPRGVYCRLQPESMSFLDLAAEIGPKLLMETALRRYSVLSVNSTIVIEYGDVRYYVRVAELKPASVVSLCGDVDLEMDFMPPEGSDPKRPSTGKLTASNYSTCIQPLTRDLNAGETRSPDSNLPFIVGYGRRLRDGGYVESTITVANNTTSNVSTPRKISVKSLQKVQQRDKQSKSISPGGVAAVAAATESSLLALQLRSAQRAFTTPGCTLGTAEHMESHEDSTSPVDMVQQNSMHNDSRPINAAIDLSASGTQPNVQKCNLCLADVPSINIDLHTLRCIKNPGYHKFECLICHERVLQVNESRHQHCPNCPIICDSSEALAEHQRDEHTASCQCTLCGGLFTRVSLQDHLDNGRCDHILVPCSLCGLAFKMKDLAHHFRVCSSRTERCDGCMSYIKITEYDTHNEQCELLAILHAPVADRIDSVSYELSPPRTKLSNQTAIKCVYCLQEGFPSITAVEHHVMLDCSIAKSFVVPEFVKAGNTNQEADEPLKEISEVEEPHSDEIPRPVLAQGRMRRKGDTSALLISKQVLNSISNNGKPRRPKRRPNPQLQALPQRTSKSVATPEDSRAMELRDLCISNADGTSHRTLPAPSRTRTNTQARRRSTAKLHPCGRLDKLP